MCRCVQVCTSVQVCLCATVHVCACSSHCMSAHVYLHMQLHPCVCLHTRAHRRVHRCVHLLTHLSARVCVHTQLTHSSHTHTCVHRSTHCSHLCTQLWLQTHTHLCAHTEHTPPPQHSVLPLIQVHILNIYPPAHCHTSHTCKHLHTPTAEVGAHPTPPHRHPLCSQVCTHSSAHPRASTHTRTHC